MSPNKSFNLRLFISHFYVFLICHVQLCLSLSDPGHLNLSLAAHNSHWSIAGATWYGIPSGAGSDGGACGYGEAVSQPPFSSLVTGIGPSLYMSGKECGACYQIKCTKNPACSGKPVRVTITDFCPGGPCLSGSAHFDLSGTAFGAMAKPGHENQLRNAGVLQIQYTRVECDYPGKTITFHVDQGSNPFYFSTLIEFEDGDGDIGGIELKDCSTHEWRPLYQSWGAVWAINSGSMLKGPISIQIKTELSGEKLVAKNVIPHNWKPGATYRSLVNFPF